MRNVRVNINLDRCSGTGVCVLSAPDVFDQSAQDGKVFVLANANTEEHLNAIRDAVTNCPTRALSLDERE
jgi:ferredoxin